MSLDRDRWVLGASVVSESAWVYALMAVAGVAFGVGGSPLAWTAVLAIMAISVLVSRLLPSGTTGMRPVLGTRMAIGVAVIYVVVGTQASGGVDLGWVFKVASGSAPEGFTPKAVMGCLFGVLLWWRGGMLAAQELATELLAMSFRIGVPALAFSAIVDVFNDIDLNITPMIFIFFAAGLGGLGIGHLLPETEGANKSSAWVRLMAGLVAGVLLIGLAFSFVQGEVLSYVTAPFYAIYEAAVALLIWGVFLPIAYVFFFIFDLILDLLGRPLGGQAPEEGQQSQTNQAEDFAESLGLLEGTGQNIWIVQLVAAVLLSAAAIALLYLAARAVRSRTAGRSTGNRESVRGEADVVFDSARLLAGLLPDWLLRRRKRRAFKLPDGPPGVVDVLKLYYQLLTMAEERGITRGPHQTAGQFQNALAQAFPQDLVRAITDAFNRAFYGSHSLAEEQIADMRSTLEGQALQPI